MLIIFALSSTCVIVLGYVDVYDICHFHDLWKGKSCLLAWEMRAFKRVDNVLMIYEWFWLLCVQFLSML